MATHREIEPNAPRRGDPHSLDARAQRFALWSVYYHAFFSRGLRPPALPEAFHPLPLGVALEIFTRDFDAHDVTRRRRVLAKLAAAGLVRTEDLERKVGLEQAKLLRRLIERIADRAELDSGGLAKIDEIDPGRPSRELDRLMAPVCQWDTETPTCTSCYDGPTLVTTTTATLRIKRKLDELRKPLDPRCWDECADVFLETYPVTRSGSDWVETPIAAPLGDPWTGKLREKVQAGYGSFDNVLSIDFQVDSPSSGVVTRVEAKYGLWEALSAELAGIPSQGLLGIDEGFVRATPDPSDAAWTLLETQKSVRFKDTSAGLGGKWDLGEMLNYLAPAMLCLWLDDVVTMGPCCEIP